jgi:hypothetical protein
MIVYCTKLHLCKWSGLWFISTKQNMNFNFQLLVMFFLFLTTMTSLKIVQSLKICQHAKFYVDWFEFCIHFRSHLPPWNDLSYGIKNYVIDVTFNGQLFVLDLINIFFFKNCWGDRLTDRKVIS